MKIVFLCITSALSTSSALTVMHFTSEAVSVDEYEDCCLHGKVSIPFLHCLPVDLYALYSSMDQCGKNFCSHLHQYNKAFAFTSTGGPGHVDGSVLDGQGPPCYKIQGVLYHQLGPVQPEDSVTLL
jgi:hypothetical protein